MKITLCIIATMLLVGSKDGGPGKVESMIRGHIERCEADGLRIPAVEITTELFDKLVDEVGWQRIRGSHGHRRWVIFETPDPTRKSGKRYFRVEQRP